ncbi:MAG: Gfo/Idh/MocA family oxidoreductase [Phycisphaerales bacterium]|nr:Gfo/Idh/MocA family oxidoreductase [Phycisphaerales bacterium]
MKTIGFGIIGGGLMGREFASAVARWAHLLDFDGRPQIVALCDKNPALYPWYKDNFPSVEQITDDYKAMLANPKVHAVYVAVPHNLHEEIYCAVIRAGKHLMGEKPFGIDKKANDAINQCIAEHPNVLVRSSSEFPFFPAMQRIGEMIEANAFGRIIEAHGGFLHCSDLDPNKPINWKRMIQFNGEYGCMGDLGLHVCHVPFRAGWTPKTVRAVLSKIVSERPDGKGGMAPCLTWDNATLLCDAINPADGNGFPLTLRTHRIAPGQKNTWYSEIWGTKKSARWSSLNPKILEVMDYTGGDQTWQQVQTGYESAFKSITGPNFEFGFSDSIQQMWAAFMYELIHGKPLKKFAGCVTPQEAALSHRLFTAALKSHKESTTVTI